MKRIALAALIAVASISTAFADGLTIYSYDPRTGEYQGAATARPDPLEKGRWLIPAHAVTAAPPSVSAGQAAVWDGAAWKLVPDKRGTVYYCPDGSRGEVENLGADIPPDCAPTPPPPSLIQPSWDGAAWTESAEPEVVAAAAQLEADRAARAQELADKLTGLTPAQINAYIDANVTDLASARVYLRRLTLLVWHLAKIHEGQ